MHYDKDVARLEREAREAERKAVEKQRAAAEAKRRARAARLRLNSETKHENWHCRALAGHLRQAGYGGEHAEALFYFRQLEVVKYFEALLPYTQANKGKSLLAIEHLAVLDNLSEWTEKGKQLHWDAERRAYEEECAAFLLWQAENPEKTSWREKPATRRQYFLIWRTATMLDIEQPTSIKCGEAHDWLVEHDANLRFRGPPPAPESKDQGGARD